MANIPDTHATSQTIPSFLLHQVMSEYRVVSAPPIPLVGGPIFKGASYKTKDAPWPQGRHQPPGIFTTFSCPAPTVPSTSPRDI